MGLFVGARTKQCKPLDAKVNKRMFSSSQTLPPSVLLPTIASVGSATKEFMSKELTRAAPTGCHLFRGVRRQLQYVEAC
jgi:hypothetical protein